MTLHLKVFLLFFSFFQEKISAIIDIVMLTPLPLNSEIENLIQSGLEIQHPLYVFMFCHLYILNLLVLFILLTKMNGNMGLLNSKYFTFLGGLFSSLSLPYIFLFIPNMDFFFTFSGLAN